MEVGINSLGRVFMFEGSQEAGLHGDPAIFVNAECLQAVPPGLGRTSEDGGEFSDYAADIPGGNFSGSLNSIIRHCPVVVSLVSSPWNRGRSVDHFRRSWMVRASWKSVGLG